MADNLKPKQTHSQTLKLSEYSHAITKIAVTQICQTIGFKASQSSAIDALTRIATLYLQSLAKFACSSATISGGRTQCNLFDIIHALEQIHHSTGFSGAGDPTRPILSSTTLKELRHFVYAINEVPFARRIEGISPGSVIFPAMTQENSRVGMGSEVPRWLPEFPCFEEKEEVKRVSKKRELLWEEREEIGLPLVVCVGVKEKKKKKKKKKGGGGGVGGLRERVKFRIGERNGKVGGVNDLELRNGVCRGGKRVCLVNHGLNATFFDGDEEQQPMDIENGNIKVKDPNPMVD